MIFEKTSGIAESSELLWFYFLFLKVGWLATAHCWTCHTYLQLLTFTAGIKAGA